MRVPGRSRLVMIVGVFLSGMIVASALTWQLDMWPRANAAANPYACGHVTVAGTSWLGGQGVDVHSNGEFQTKGTSCAFDNKAVFNLNANPPAFGYGWQCFELVNRLYAARGWFPRLWLGAEANDAAKWLYVHAQRGDYAGLTGHANGSGYKPVPGDVVVHSNGKYGHVAVVDRIEGRTLHAVEQNNSVAGRATYAYDPVTGAVSKAGITISGYVHAAKNTGNQQPPASTPQPAPAEDVKLKINGSCTPDGGELVGVSSGFTPGGEVSIAAWHSDGRQYANLKTTAIARPDGSFPWRWPCKGDPPDTYGTRAVDLSTGRHVDAFFTITAAPQRPATTKPPAQPPTTPAQQPQPPQPQPPRQPEPPQPPPPPPAPKPIAANLVVVPHGGGRVGVAFDVGWQSGRDPVTCHFFIDGREAFTAQCGTRSSKQFSGISPGEHSFYATVSDRFGVFSDPTATIVKHVT